MDHFLYKQRKCINREVLARPNIKKRSCFRISIFRFQGHSFRTGRKLHPPGHRHKGIPGGLALFPKCQCMEQGRHGCRSNPKRVRIVLSSALPSVPSIGYLFRSLRMATQSFVSRHFARCILRIKADRTCDFLKSKLSFSPKRLQGMTEMKLLPY